MGWRNGCLWLRENAVAGSSVGEQFHGPQWRAGDGKVGKAACVPSSNALMMFEETGFLC